MRILSILSVFLSIAILTEPSRADASVSAGEKLAAQHCARCHVVGTANPHGGINSTPSFQLLARRDDWRERFQTFYARRPHPVFVRVPNVAPWTDLPSPVEPFTITPAEIEQIIDFVDTLRPQ